jgi:biopolymer transport protein ExbB
MNTVANVGDLLSFGGWVMYPIYACSLVAIAVFVQRILVFRAHRLGELAWLGEVFAAAGKGDMSAVGETCRRHPHPAARVLEAAASVYNRRPDRVEAEAGRVGSKELQRLEYYIPVLAFIAQVAPLLGLLGTALGMVQLFLGLQSLTPGAVDVGVISSGIWQALLTTVAGLVVAVPTMAAHAYLVSRINGVRLRLHDVVEQFITAVPRAKDEGDLSVVRDISEVRA